MILAGEGVRRIREQQSSNRGKQNANGFVVLLQSEALNPKVSRTARTDLGSLPLDALTFRCLNIVARLLHCCGRVAKLSTSLWAKLSAIS